MSKAYELSDQQFMRFSAQILLPEFGELGQQTLQMSKAVVIGVGGLGHAVAQQLAAAGIAELILFDDDKVELSNLPRQLLFTDSDIGKAKVTVAAQKLSLAYEDCTITARQKRFTEQDADVLQSVDIIFDCTDNFESRLLNNKVAVKYQIPLISAAISGYQGQLLCVAPAYEPLSVTASMHDTSLASSTQANSTQTKSAKALPNNRSGCFQCLFPEDTLMAQKCSVLGVLNAAVLSVASMQTLMGLQWLSGDDDAKQSLIGLLHLFDARSLQWRQVTLSQDAECPVCYTS
ncbi:HesA/MoeB/ThiF family protein [Shewanella sp. MMG014]|uniref:HesA/MoeB/ThiF family protein n=1 Tax=Shewanella sp. MMG014 TaxID=2822691 RepID=UPI001B358312|nr:HesA/MoeB/ThiF family protein [Shewanella sp. MMG014]MBQ4891041.1 HesA/MoeB/ThiF family protein [Shewanella sp. MMG014]